MAEWDQVPGTSMMHNAGDQDAARIAGLRCCAINEPTAAALAYASKKRERTFVVYDLGGAPRRHILVLRWWFQVK